MKQFKANTVKSDNRIPELDGLRGLAVLMILAAHYVYGAFLPDDKSALAVSVHFILSLAWSGVDLFFVLSGFLIGGILMDQRDTENFFKVFYLRRVCRIFPLYFLWLALFVLLLIFASRHLPQAWVLPVFDLQGIPLWLYFCFLQNFHIAQGGLCGPTWLGGTWSLAIEEQFYLLMPLLIWVTPVRRLSHLLAVLILLVPLCRLYLYLYHYGVFQYVLPFCRADGLLLGVICAWLLRNSTARNWIKANQRRVFQLFLVLVLGVVYLACIAKGQDTFQVANLFEIRTWGFTWLALFYACLLLIAVTARSGMIVRILRIPALCKLGMIAYGVYLIQGVMLVVMYGLMGTEPQIKTFTDAFVTLVAFIATLILATLSWRFFEKPIIKWGHSFSYSGNKIHEAE